MGGTGAVTPSSSGVTGTGIAPTDGTRSTVRRVRRTSSPAPGTERVTLGRTAATTRTAAPMARTRRTASSASRGTSTARYGDQRPECEAASEMKRVDSVL